ncbi:crotonase/enoyl-CoA hydratase family protein [Altererythrobacter sp. CAU 1778]
MSEQRITIEVTDHVAQVRLARPDKMNALDPAMFDALANIGDALAAHPGVRAVVLSGEGRAFCAGLDLASMAAGGSGNDLSARTHGNANTPQQAAMAWRKLPMPVVAAIHGVCFGGGLQIASGADIRVAAPDTRMAVMEAKWGLVPDMAGYPLWRGNVRDDVLRELTYTAREFSGEEAREYGFVTHVDADPLAQATAIAREIAARSPHASRAAKRISNAWYDDSTDALLLRESEEQIKLLRSPNQIESVRAGMAKEPPSFHDA